MKYNIHNVPDPTHWHIIDARTGLHFNPPGCGGGNDWIIIEVDDGQHTVTFQDMGTLEITEIYVPVVIVDLTRKCILINFRPLQELLTRESGIMQTIPFVAQTHP